MTRFLIYLKIGEPSDDDVLPYQQLFFTFSNALSRGVALRALEQVDIRKLRQWDYCAHRRIYA